MIILKWKFHLKIVKKIMHTNLLFHGSKLNRHDLLQLIQLLQQRKQLIDKLRIVLAES